MAATRSVSEAGKDGVEKRKWRKEREKERERNK
jgi:hypothetical protein